MFNLLRSDAYRTVRSPFFWVICTIIVAVMFAIVGLMSWLASPEFAQMINDSVTEQSMHLDAEKRAEAQSELDESMAELQTLNNKVLSSMTAMWSASFLDGGFLGLMGSLFVVLYLLADFRKGFVKNLPMGRQGRWRYYAEKVAFIALAQAFFLMLCAVSSTVAYALFGFSYEHADPIGGMALWLLLAWFVCVAYALIVACLCWTLRNEAVGAVAAVAVSSGMAGAFLTQLLLYAGRVVPVLGAVPQWLPVSAIADLRQCAEGLGNANPDYLFAQMPLWGHALMISLLASAVMCAIAFVGCRRKDVA